MSADAGGDPRLGKQHKEGNSYTNEGEILVSHLCPSPELTRTCDARDLPLVHSPQPKSGNSEMVRDLAAVRNRKVSFWLISSPTCTLNKGKELTSTSEGGGPLVIKSSLLR